MAVKLIKSNRTFISDGYALDPAALEEGDQVAMVHRQGSAPAVYTVTRRTKTQIVTVNGRGHEVRFRAEDGSLVGDSRHSRLKAMFDPEVLSALEYRRLDDLDRAITQALKTRPHNHTERLDLVNSLSGLTARAHEDLVRIRSGIREWNAAVADVEG